MPLEWPSLDDLRFQPLVDQAKTRIIRYCPEWTEYNVSDPGVTLIELFAWMTDQTVYRLNQLPAKNYVAFLNMLGVRPQPAKSARTELTFRLGAPFNVPPKGDPSHTLIGQHFVVSTQEQPGVETAIFTTEDDLLISTAVITHIYAGLHDAQPLTTPPDDLRGRPFSAFDADPLRTQSNTEVPPPREGTFFAIGLDPAFNPEVDRPTTLRGHIITLHFACEPEKASGHNQQNPPLLWECWGGEKDQAKWLPLEVSKEEDEADTTKGFSALNGKVTFYLPLSLQRGDPVASRVAYWLRCKFQCKDAQQPPYTISPRINQVRCEVIGATTTARHANFVHEEELGISDGKPGQIYHLQHAPILDLEQGETLEVEESVEERVGETKGRRLEKKYRTWERVPNFANSCCHDRHYCLDASTGEVTFGPGIVQPDGTVRQYGRIPEPGCKIRITRYRYGGGLLGNVPAKQLSVMRAAAPYVDRVINRKSAMGGCDLEGLEQTIMRAQQEMFDTHRAVTAEDFEKLALQTDGGDKVARAKVITPAMAAKRAERAKQKQTGNTTLNTPAGAAHPLGAIQLLVTPSVLDAVTKGELGSLVVAEELRTKILAYLEPRRLLTTLVEIGEPRYLGVKVEATIVAAAPQTAPDDLEKYVSNALCRYITPIKLADPKANPKANGDDLFPPNWVGWPFGQNLLIADLFTFIQKLKGVKHVLNVQISSCEVEPRAIVGSVYIDTAAAGTNPQGSNLQLTPLTGNRLEVDPDTLLCSLKHEIKVVDL
ncbi:MAG: putative baseplate assembly protein [Caldilineaceae bacterium]